MHVKTSIHEKQTAGKPTKTVRLLGYTEGKVIIKIKKHQL